MAMEMREGESESESGRRTSPAPSTEYPGTFLGTYPEEQMQAAPVGVNWVASTVWT